MLSIPSTLSPFFQEFDLEQLDAESAAPLVIERALQFADRAELRWLFSQYPRARIADWLKRYARERLPEPHRTFWKIVLEVSE